ncbi:cobaltochelatase subunit CobN, partial [Chamaesiphon sp. VAR_48_metabat_403]|uniref:cobaltochelatase subunit CobN n=1 Tax=Chamaesiphon sp. VAR_48_metabat_403 TaxID=2964700 RepID=UPI00286E4C29
MNIDSRTDLDPIPPFLRGARGDSPSKLSTTTYPIPGIQFGNVFVGIQPARGYDKDPNLNYHAPDLVPPHQYV